MLTNRIKYIMTSIIEVIEEDINEQRKIMDIMNDHCSIPSWYTNQYKNIPNTTEYFMWNTIKYHICKKENGIYTAYIEIPKKLKYHFFTIFNSYENKEFFDDDLKLSKIFEYIITFYDGSKIGIDTKGPYDFKPDSILHTLPSINMFGLSNEKIKSQQKLTSDELFICPKFWTYNMIYKITTELAKKVFFMNYDKNELRFQDILNKLKSKLFDVTFVYT